MIKNNQFRLLARQAQFKQTELGKIPKGWEILKLIDICELQRGFDLPILKRKKGQIPIIASTGINGFHNEYKAKCPGVTTGRSGSLGTCLYIKEKFWPLNTTLWVKNFKGNNPYFVYQLLKLLNFSKYNAGSGVPTLNRNHIHKISVIFPKNIKIQQKIANVLGSLDDKIELLGKQNSTLESLGQTIFKKWFIDNKNENWEKCKIKDLTGLISRGPSIKYTNKKGIPVLNQRCIRDGEIKLEAVLEAKELSENKNHLYLQKNDILINSMGVGTLGRISRNLSIDKKMIIHNCITVVRSNNNFSKYLLYYFIKILEPEITKMGSGTTGQTSLNINNIKNIEIYIPDKKIQEQFDKIISKIWVKIGNNIKQIQTLSQIRDLLLPKLMIGKVRVK